MFATGVAGLIGPLITYIAHNQLGKLVEHPSAQPQFIQASFEDLGEAVGRFLQEPEKGDPRDSWGCSLSQHPAILREKQPVPPPNALEVREGALGMNFGRLGHFHMVVGKHFACLLIVA